MSDNQIRAPWTPEQVEALNRWQAGDFVQPYTCGSGYRTNKSIHPDGEGKLVATTDGWMCPNCDYKQDWAWAGSLEVEHFDFRAQLMQAMKEAGADIVEIQPHEKANR